MVFMRGKGPSRAAHLLEMGSDSERRACSGSTGALLCFCRGQGFQEEFKTLHRADGGRWLMRVFLAENYASSLENSFFFFFFPFHAVLFFNCRPGNWLPGKHLLKKAFLNFFSLSVTSKMLFCGNEQLHREKKFCGLRRQNV